MATIAQLLQQIAQNRSVPAVPAPAQSLPLGIPQQLPPGPAPGPAPVAPAPALDRGLIEQYRQFAGAPPTPPPQASTLQRVAAALMGVGAGTQGQGPQFIQQLQQPQRQYEAQLLDFQQRQAALGLRGFEQAQENQLRGQRRTQDVADEVSRREFQSYTEDARAARQLAQEQREMAAAIELQARKLQVEAAKEERRQRLAQEKEARAYAVRFGDGPGAAPAAIAKELGEYYAGIREGLSPAAARYETNRANLDAIRQRRLALGFRGGSGASNAAQRAVANFEAAKAAVGLAVGRRDDPQAERLARRRMDAAFGALARFPGQIETGVGQGGWPFAKLVTPTGNVGLVPGGSAPAPQQQPQAAQPAPDPLGIR